MQQFMERRKCKNCRALCCGSRISVSSSTSSEEIKNFDSDHSDSSWSNLAHGMVQSRLDRMINGTTKRHAQTSKLVVLIARDQNSYDPRRDFRDSILEVITSKGMKEPNELRMLLNCYVSINSRENRQVILEAFHDVCLNLFF